MTEVYAGLDVSDKLTHVCVVDATGVVLWAGACATDPDVIARTLKTRTPKRGAKGLVRVVLETGSLSAFLYHGLVERGVPAICVCARHAKGVLSARVNKSDPHDAEGLAQMARTGWFKQVHIKAEATHMDRARLKIREQLVSARLAMAGQLRGLLKLFGLRLGKVTTPARRRERLVALFAQKPELEPIFKPLIESLEAIELQIRGASKQLAAQAAADPVTARLMTTPGVGPITALVFKTSIEDPGRFSRGGDAGAFAGLAPPQITQITVTVAITPKLRHRFRRRPALAGRQGHPRPRLHLSDPGRRSHRSTDQLGLAQRPVGLSLIEVLIQKRPEVADPLQRRLDGDHPVAAARQVRDGARPAPVLRPRRQPRPHRVQGHIAQRRDQMALIHRHRAIAALPQVAARAHPGVDIAGVVAMHLAERAPQTVRARRCDDQVHMVGHQAVGPHLHPRRPRRLGQQVEVELVVAVLKERWLTPIPTLGDVMRDAGDHDAGEAGHGREGGGVWGLL